MCRNMSMDKPTSRSFPICPKCNESCFKSDGQLVRALNQVYHYSCFVCEVITRAIMSTANKEIK